MTEDIKENKMKIEEHGGFLHVTEDNDITNEKEEEYKRSELFKKAIAILELPATSRSSAHINSLREYFEKEFQGFFMKV